MATARSSWPSTGEGEGALEATRSNRLVAGLEAALEVELGPRPASIGWRIEMHNRIPLSRGLGSSAAATVGGVVLGDALACAVGAPPLPPLRLLQLATTIESHPDNAAAVLLGGFVVSAQLADRVEAIRFDAPRRAPVRPVHPGPPPRDGGDAARPARRGPARATR